jgi:hypothetical protein
MKPDKPRFVLELLRGGKSKKGLCYNLCLAVAAAVDQMQKIRLTFVRLWRLKIVLNKGGNIPT